MGRPRKEVTAETAIVKVNVEETFAPIERLTLSKNQIETIQRSKERIANTGASLDRIAREKMSLKQKIDASPESKRLKELKTIEKTLKSIYKDSTSAYNGVLEFALSEVEGKTLSEKIQRINQLN